MKQPELNLAVFSPTGTSRKIGEAVASGICAAPVGIMDVTLVSLPGDTVVADDSVTVFAVPVYGGHVAPLALKRLEGLRARGAAAVAIAVYGNRAYENALTELGDFLSGRGFRVIAGGAFVGEHSYSNSAYSIAEGRPDASDLRCARELGERIRKKLDAAADIQCVGTVDLDGIEPPLQSPDAIRLFGEGAARLRNGGVPLPVAPVADAAVCIHCGFCAAHCPTGAIVEGDECNTAADRCIKCCACVKGCPVGARTYDTPFAALLAGLFAERKENVTAV